MSVAQLEYFVAVAEEGHVGRAAARLHLSQPPLSRQIRQLEDELGVALFARTARGMRLLPSGERFLVHARKVLAALEEARRSVEDARQPHARRSASSTAGLTQGCPSTAR